MLRLVPLGWLGAGLDGAGWTVRAGRCRAGRAGLDGAGDGVVGVQLPFDTCRPLLAPAVAATTFGTQLAPSGLKEYGMLTVVVDTGFGPAGLWSLLRADQVTLSKMLPLTCQVPASVV